MAFNPNPLMNPGLSSTLGPGGQDTDTANITGAQPPPVSPVGPVNVPQAAQPTQPAGSPGQGIMGHAFGKILSGLSGQHNEYSVDPNTGRTVATPVKDPPGQTFRSILALGLMGAKGIGPRSGDMTFTQGLLSGLGGGSQEAMQRKDFLDQQARAQAQQDYQNQLKAQESQRQNKQLSLNEQLNKVQIANFNQEQMARKQLMDHQAYQWAKESADDAAKYLVQNSQTAQALDASKVQGYNELGVEPALDSAGKKLENVDWKTVQQYLKDHPGSSAEKIALHTGTKQEYDPNTKQSTVDDLYTIYPPMTKVPEVLLEDLKQAIGGDKKSNLLPVYNDLLKNRDNTDSGKILSAWRAIGSVESNEKIAAGIAKDRAEAQKDLLEGMKASLEFRAEKLEGQQKTDFLAGQDLATKYLNFQTNQVRQDGYNQDLASIQPSVPGGTLTPVQVKENQKRTEQRRQLAAYINAREDAATSAMDKAHFSIDKNTGKIVSSDPKLSLITDQINNATGAVSQLLSGQPGQVQTTGTPGQPQTNVPQAIQRTVDIIKQTPEFKSGDANNIQKLMNTSGIPEESQKQVWDALGITPPDTLSPLGRGMLEGAKKIGQSPATGIVTSLIP